MTSPLPQVLVAGVAIYIQYKKLWICGSVEYATACFSHQWTRIGEGYKLSPTRNYTTFHALTGLAHSSGAKYRYNENLLEITNLAVTIQKTAQHIIKLRNITTFAYYMIC